MARIKKRKRRVPYHPILVPVGLVLFSAWVIFNPTWRPSFFSSGERLFLAISLPLQTLMTEGISTLEKWGDDYLLAVHRNEEVRRLQNENRMLAAQTQRFREVSLENLRLRAMLQFQADQGSSLIAARVVGHGFSGRAATLRINRGSEEGIHLNSAVVTQEGVVGQVWSVSPHSSEVISIADQSSAVDARISRSRAWGILEGRSEPFCLLDFVRKTESVEMGDEVVTSGLDGVFPRGLLLGTVIEVKKDPNRVSPQIVVQPAVDVTKLEEVFIYAESFSQK